MIKTNYHTHSTFCDGKNTAEEIILCAIEKNFDILGFSSHSMFPFSSDWHLPSNSHKEYADSIRSLAKKYSDKIEIYTGFEADYISGVCCPSFENYRDFSPDYLIGSIHFVPGKKGFIEADGSFDDVRKGINSFFNGDIKAAVCEYFALEREMIEKGNFTFIGHPDLIKKQNAGSTKLFDETEEWYKSEVKATARALSKAGICVEVNTGGILRSGQKEPYPSPYFLETLNSLNVPVTLNSDAHTLKGLDVWFEEGYEYIKKAGYKEIMYFQAGSLKSQVIK